MPLILLENDLVILMLKRLIPERPDEDAHDLWSLQDLPDVKEQRAVHAHKTLAINLVRLVQDAAHFVVQAAQGGDDLLELVADVQLVRVEKQ
eukprot:scaffold3184_cov254-Pinguiococcus_pyrenoidosus.AAC.3